MQSLVDYFKKYQPLSKEAEQAIINISSMVDIGKNKDLQPTGHTCKTIYFIEKMYYFPLMWADGQQKATLN